MAAAWEPSAGFCLGRLAPSAWQPGPPGAPQGTAQRMAQGADKGNTIPEPGDAIRGMGRGPRIRGTTASAAALSCRRGPGSCVHMLIGKAASMGETSEPPFTSDHPLTTNSNIHNKITMMYFHPTHQGNRGQHADGVASTQAVHIQQHVGEDLDLSTCPLHRDAHEGAAIAAQHNGALILLWRRSNLTSYCNQPRGGAGIHGSQGLQGE